MSDLAFDAIVFDFDGVLVESVDVKTRAFAELYQPYGESVVERVLAFHMANGGVSRFEKFRYFHRHFLNRELSAAEEEELGERFSSLVEDAVVASEWVAGAREFLEANYRELPLYVASGTPDDELRHILERRSVMHYFKAASGSPLKKAEIICRFAGADDLALDRILMIGDATTDLEGAVGAGTAFLGRVKLGELNPFPDSVPIVPDLHNLHSFLCV